MRLLFTIEYANVGATKVIGFHLRPGSILTFLEEDSEAEMRAQIMLDPDLPGHDRLEEIVALKQEFGHLIQLEDIA